MQALVLPSGHFILAILDYLRLFNQTQILRFLDVLEIMFCVLSLWGTDFGFIVIQCDINVENMYRDQIISHMKMYLCIAF